MALKKFTIPPEESRYTFKDGEETLRAELEGGKGRYRKDILNATYRVTVRWVLNQIQYEYLRAFYKATTTADSGSSPFLIDLLLDEAQQLTEHTAYFIPKKLKLNKVRGLSHEVQAELEVIPKEYTDGYFDTVVFFYETYGENQQGAADLLNQLEQLVNVDLPGEDVFTP